LLDHDSESSAMLLEWPDGAHAPASIENDDVAMSILAKLQVRLVCAPAPGPAWRYQPRKDSGPTPSSRAIAVTVRPVESTSVMASFLNSAVYRFV
jgi:hypothetical protein